MVVEEDIARQGFAKSCLNVLAKGMPALELEQNPDRSITTLTKNISAIENTGQTSALFLGCAGMTDIYKGRQSHHKTAPVDPVISAARLM